MTTAKPCTFCAIVAGHQSATIVYSDESTIAFLDVRQFHAGHVLVIPREHLADIRSATAATAGAVLATVANIARAVDAAFPSDGLSVWHSAGVGANQEVPHLHFHVHPRRIGDAVLRIYPSSPSYPHRDTLEQWGARIREVLE